MRLLPVIAIILLNNIVAEINVSSSKCLWLFQWVFTLMGEELEFTSGWKEEMEGDTKGRKRDEEKQKGKRKLWHSGRQGNVSLPGPLRSYLLKVQVHLL